MKIDFGNFVVKFRHRRTGKLCAVAMLIGLCSSLTAQEPTTALQLSPPVGAIPSTYFGVVCCLNPTDPYPNVGGAWINAKAYWDRVEPVKGKWTFAVPDAIAEAAQRAHVDNAFILGRTAPWASARPNEAPFDSWEPHHGIRAEPANLNDWTTYIRTVVQRYRGRVHTYLLWNEPNQHASFTGTIDAMAALNNSAYAAIKQADPSATVVSSSLGDNPQTFAYLDELLTKSGGCSCDVVGFHFYTDIYKNSIPEKMVGVIDRVRKILAKHGLQNKPIWNTESGYAIENVPGARQTFANFHAHVPVLNAQQSQNLLVRAYVLGWALGIRRFYWYAWDEQHYALTDNRGRIEKPVTRAYRAIENRLVGSTMLSCTRSQSGTWIAHLKSSRHSSFWIVWNDTGSERFAIPRKWRVSRITDIGNLKLPIAKTLNIGATPLFIEGR